LPAPGALQNLPLHPVNARAHAGAPAQYHASNNMLRRNRRIAFLSGIASRHKTIAFEVLEDEPVRTKSPRSLCNHDIAHPQPHGWHALNAQRFAVFNQWQHAASTGLKFNVVTGGEQSSAHLLEQGGIAALFSRGTQEWSPQRLDREQIGSGNRALH
jgi:hypothetical protein